MSNIVDIVARKIVLLHVINIFLKIHQDMMKKLMKQDLKTTKKTTRTGKRRTGRLCQARF